MSGESSDAPPLRPDKVWIESRVKDQLNAKKAEVMEHYTNRVHSGIPTVDDILMFIVGDLKEGRTDEELKAIYKAKKRGRIFLENLNAEYVKAKSMNAVLDTIQKYWHKLAEASYNIAQLKYGSGVKDTHDSFEENFLINIIAILTVALKLKLPEIFPNESIPWLIDDYAMTDHDFHYGGATKKSRTSKTRSRSRRSRSRGKQTRRSKSRRASRSRSRRYKSRSRSRKNLLKRVCKALSRSRSRSRR